MYFLDFHGFLLILINFHGFPRFCMDLKGSGTRMSDPLWQPENPCAAGLDPLYIKIADSGGLDLEAWCLDAWMLKDWNGLEEVTEGLEGMGGGDWKKFSHAQASGARRIFGAYWAHAGAFSSSFLGGPESSRDGPALAKAGLNKMICEAIHLGTILPSHNGHMPSNKI